MILKQRGRNNKYPEIIETWKPGEKVPEWLSNICKIGYIVDNELQLELKTKMNRTGGFGLISSGSTNQIIVETKTKEDFICWGDSRLFSLTPKQMELLYKKL